MKLKISDFGGNVNSTNYDFVISEIDGLELIKDITVKGTFIKSKDIAVGEIYELKGFYSGKIKLECVRCLKEISQDIDGEFNWRFLDPKDYTDYIKSLGEESEIDSEGYEEALNGEIDIVECIRQQILLDLDAYPMCKPFCDDDSIVKKYSDDGIDQRWAKLLDIKD